MNWKNMPPAHKIATVIAAIAALFVVIATVKPDLLPFDPTYPAISVFTLCEAIIYWNQKRKWAYLLIIAAVICLGSFILGEFLLAA